MMRIFLSEREYKVVKLFLSLLTSIDKPFNTIIQSEIESNDSGKPNRLDMNIHILKDKYFNQLKLDVCIYNATRIKIKVKGGMVLRNKANELYVIDVTPAQIQNLNNLISILYSLAIDIQKELLVFMDKYYFIHHTMFIYENNQIRCRYKFNTEQSQWVRIFAISTLCDMVYDEVANLFLFKRILSRTIQESSNEKSRQAVN